MLGRDVILHAVWSIGKIIRGECYFGLGENSKRGKTGQILAYFYISRAVFLRECVCLGILIFGVWP